MVGRTIKTNDGDDNVMVDTKKKTTVTRLFRFVCIMSRLR